MKTKNNSRIAFISGHAFGVAVLSGILKSTEFLNGKITISALLNLGEILVSNLE